MGNKVNMIKWTGIVIFVNCQLNDWPDLNLAKLGEIISRILKGSFSISRTKMDVGDNRLALAFDAITDVTKTRMMAVMAEEAVRHVRQLIPMGSGLTAGDLVVIAYLRPLMIDDRYNRRQADVRGAGQRRQENQILMDH